jgi:KaiC/GvpD/RAD55 family RecA-like ATPase
LPRLPLIEDLTSGPIPAGSILLVEYDPASQWYNASFTITAGWLKTGGKADYNTMTRPPEDIRAQLRRVGLEPESLEREGKLIITDWYSATLGQKSKEKYSHESLKISDLSIHFAQTLMRGEPEPGMLSMLDDESTFARFNDEKAWLELELTRMIPGLRLRKNIGLVPIMEGVLSEWVRKRFEGASDGVIDFKVEESGGEVRNLMRIRLMRNVHFDSKWHALKIGENFEVTLEK